MKGKVLLLLLLLCGCGKCLAQAGTTHVEVQGGYELFPGMSRLSGFDINVGGRYSFDERYFVALMLHSGINNGKYEAMYAGETTRLEHTLREYILGVGPGVYLYNGGNRWIYAMALVGYGIGEELKASAESETRSLNGLAALLQLGVERQVNNGVVVGLNAGGYLIHGKVYPAINLKCGFFLSL